MKKISFLLFILTAFTLSAQKPTNQQVVDMIKKDLKTELLKNKKYLFSTYYLGYLVGAPINGYPFFNGSPEFKEVKINSVKLTKVGKAGSNYYKEGGDYVSSYFYVKALVDGSAVLKDIYCFGSFDVNLEETKKCGRTKYLDGEMTFRKVAHQFLITTDEYGDWTAVYNGIANDEDTIDLFKNINKIYWKKHPKKKNIKEEKKKDVLQSFIDSGKEEEKKINDFLTKSRENNKAKVLEIKHQLTVPKDLRKFTKIEKKCVNKDWLCGGEISDFEYFYLPLVKIEKEHHTKLVKNVVHKNTSLKQHEKDMKLLNDFFDKHPNVKKKFYSGYINPSYLGKFSTYITIQKTKEASYLVFLELSKHLMSIKKPKSKK